MVPSIASYIVVSGIFTINAQSQWLFCGDGVETTPRPEPHCTTFTTRQPVKHLSASLTLFFVVCTVSI